MSNEFRVNIKGVFFIRSTYTDVGKKWLGGHFIIAPRYAD